VRASKPAEPAAKAVKAPAKPAPVKSKTKKR